MTPKERAAMQQALEALELRADRSATVSHKIGAEIKAITALREALAEQAEQEPVAWGRVFDGDIIDCICPEEHALNEGCYTIPLYAAPVRTKDYNPEVTFNDDGTFSLTLPDDDELRIIPPQQEPTAEVSEEGYTWGKDGILPAGTKLYTRPARTKDLTDDEIAEIFSKYASDLYKGRAVIAADREKNK